MSPASLPARPGWAGPPSRPLEPQSPGRAPRTAPRPAAHPLVPLRPFLPLFVLSRTARRRSRHFFFLFAGEPATPRPAATTPRGAPRSLLSTAADPSRLSRCPGGARRGRAAAARRFFLLFDPPRPASHPRRSSPRLPSPRRPPVPFARFTRKMRGGARGPGQRAGRGGAEMGVVLCESAAAGGPGPAGAGGWRGQGVAWRRGGGGRGFD